MLLLFVVQAIHHLAYDRAAGGDKLDRFLAEMNKLRLQFKDESLWKTLHKMKFGNACVKETVRQHPPLIFLMRAVLKRRVKAGRNKCNIPVGRTVRGGEFT